MPIMQIKLKEADINATIVAVSKLGKRAKEAAMMELGATAEDIMAEAEKNLRKNNSIATSNLVTSGRIVRYDKGFTVAFTASYAWAIEFGRKAGTIVEIDELIPWVKKKLRINDAKQQRTVAYFVSKAIFEHGTKAKPFFYPSYEKEIKGIVERIAAAIEYAKNRRKKK